MDEESSKKFTEVALPSTLLIICDGYTGCWNLSDVNPPLMAG
jgi:hypothetical protein